MVPRLIPLLLLVPTDGFSTDVTAVITKPHSHSCSVRLAEDWQKAASGTALLDRPATLPPPAATSTDPVATLFSKVLFPGGSGKKIYFGVLQKAVDLEAIPSDEERARRRQVAADEITNIDTTERERRALVGGCMSLLTTAVAAYLLASNVAPLARAAVAPPLFLAYGYLASAKTGLWNIGQGGVWDVDGSGMQAIDDPSLAARLRSKVNDFNLHQAKVVAILTTAFVVVPELVKAVPELVKLVTL